MSFRGVFVVANGHFWPLNLNVKTVHAIESAQTDFLSFFHFFSSALAWGSSVKHQPQKVGIEHVLNDEDVVQIVKKV